MYISWLSKLQNCSYFCFIPHNELYIYIYECQVLKNILHEKKIYSKNIRYLYILSTDQNWIYIYIYIYYSFIYL